MRINCETHGEVEAVVDKNANAWCPECRNEKLKEFLESKEGKEKLSAAHTDKMQKVPPRSFVDLNGERQWAPIETLPRDKYPPIEQVIDEGMEFNDELWTGVREHARKLAELGPITSHKPGTPGFVPPPPRPLGETPGIEPPFATEYRRRIKVEDE